MEEEEELEEDELDGFLLEEEEEEGGFAEFAEGVDGARDPNRVMEFTSKGAPVDEDTFSKFSHWLGNMARERVPITITD